MNYPGKTYLTLYKMFEKKNIILNYQNSIHLYTNAIVYIVFLNFKAILVKNLFFKLLKRLLREF